MDQEEFLQRDPRLIAGQDRQLYIEIDLAKVNPFFTCSLCKGYFRDPHTVSGCLHTFCKSCLVHALQRKPECPECKVAASSKVIKPDHAVLSLLQKIYPQVELRDHELEAEFFKDFPETEVPSHLRVIKPQDDGEEEEEEQDDPVSNDQPVKRARADSTNPHPPVIRAPPTKIKLTLLAENADYNLDKPYIEASGAIKVDAMRGYIAERLKVNKDMVELTCRQERLHHHHSIEFVQRTVWRDCRMNMVWKYNVL